MSDNIRELVAMLASEVVDLAQAMGRRANTRAAERIVTLARTAAAPPAPTPAPDARRWVAVLRAEGWADGVIYLPHVADSMSLGTLPRIPVVPASELERVTRELQIAKQQVVDVIERGGDDISTLRARIAELEKERDAARAANERDRTGYTNAFNALRACMARWSWVGEGRAIYKSDDEEYRAEFGRCMAELRKIIARGERKSHAHDWADCPTTQAAVDAARSAIGIEVNGE